MRLVAVAVVGCGNVCKHYLADLAGSPHARVVALCDAVPERARTHAAAFGIKQVFTDLPTLLAEVDFELLVNLTAMPAHADVNLAALEAGRHVWSEKPLAGDLAAGRALLAAAAQHGVRLWAAPNVVCSPAFACLNELVQSGRLGRVHVGRASYGHGGPSWGPWFYQRGGGAIFDLGVYNLTTLTGLLGPARAVTALTGIAVPERVVDGQPVRVEAEDNAQILLDHGDAVYSCVSTGFVYGRAREERTIELIGTQSSAALLGWDWAPRGVEAWDDAADAWVTLAADQRGYRWQSGAAHAAACLAEDRRSPMTAEHALHVLEVMLAAQRSSAEGRTITIETSFRWPIEAPGC